MRLLEVQSITKSDKLWIFALKKLISIAQKHPLGFKKVVDKNGFIKEKIENSLKEYNENIQIANSKKKQMEHANQEKSKPKMPFKIKLTNFE
jgi:predicted transcriptional regulator